MADRPLTILAAAPAYWPATAFGGPIPVMRELARYKRVRLYTDRPGEPYRGYQTMQERLFQTVALPLYAVMTPDGQPVVYFSGLTRDPAEFISFLRAGLD